MFTLREYQDQAQQEVKKFFASGGYNCILKAPTGAGKTVIFSWISNEVNKRNKRVLVLTHREELQKQGGDKISNFDIDPIFITRRTKAPPEGKTFVSMSRTLQNRLKHKVWQAWFKGIDLIIIDECHLQDFNYIFEYAKKFGIRVIGFTATPKRDGKQRQLGLDYELIIDVTTKRKLINDRDLLPAEYFSFEAPNTKNVKFDPKTGDYQTAALFNAYNSRKLYTGVVQNYKKIADKTKALVYCVNIEHTIRTVLEFQKDGYNAKFLVSKVNKPKLKENPTEAQKSKYKLSLEKYQLYEENYKLYSGERNGVLDWFKNTPGSILINAGILTIGFDEPTIKTIIINRKTLSGTLYEQMRGRGARPHKGMESFYILDFGGHSEFPDYEEEMPFGLWHNESKGGGIAPVKYCGHDSFMLPLEKNLEGFEAVKGEILDTRKGCKRIIPASMNVCYKCGYIHPKMRPQKAVELVEITGGRRLRDLSIYELADVRKKLGHQQAWLWRQLYYRGELVSGGRKLGWSSRTIERAMAYMSKN